MILVKMKSISAGPDGVLHAGVEYPLPLERARELIEGGYATGMLETPKPATPVMETAVITPPEIAAAKPILPEVKISIPAPTWGKPKSK